MSDKERLYEIKKVAGLDYLIGGTKVEEYWDWLVKQAEKVELLQDELEKEVQSHIDTASVLSNVIKENRQIKGAYDDRCEDIDSYLQTFVDIRKVLYSCSKLEDKIKEIEEIIIFAYDNIEESENRTLEDWLR
jgi:hypothetical protein